MCGIAGYVHLAGRSPPDVGLVETMLGMLTHRGPDECGVYLDDHVGLGSARLSILDLTGGTQPISNEDETVWIVFNGEVFNHRELRADLESRHRFATRTDTEVIVHLYEELGERCVERLNGQFAFAIWDVRDRTRPRFVLARDRVGIRPLFTCVVGDRLLFASEIKAIFAHPDAVRRLDTVALNQIFTMWATLGSRTPFVGVSQLLPGEFAIMEDGNVRTERYWDLDFEPDTESRTLDDYADELWHVLRDASIRRLDADVAVGAYLSGGLDSSTITRLATDAVGPRLKTFSISFEAPEFDERPHQERAVREFGTNHAEIVCRNADVAAVFPDVVWHTEWPILRTAPAPMYLLSRLVRDHGIKVVLTGEGADEVFAGYNIFKENKIRQFWAAEPESTIRPKLMSRLYPYVAGLDGTGEVSRAFFGRGLTEVERLDYSHRIRWLNTSHLRRMLEPDVRNTVSCDPLEEVVSMLEAHPRYSTWSPLARAQYLEMTIFMSGYLLSSQGDRMTMAHSVEGRFPFLDHRIVEIAARMPDRAKLCGLNEKHVVKRAVRGTVPTSVVARTKRPFRAPIQQSLGSADFVRELLSEGNVRRAGIFLPRAMELLVDRSGRSDCRGERERDGMALAGAVSTMTLHDRFVLGSPRLEAHQVRPARRVIRRSVGV